MPELPSNRVESLRDLTALEGRIVYLVNHATDSFDRWKPFSNTEIVPWRVGPIVWRVDGAYKRIGPVYPYGDPWCVHGDDATTDSEIARVVRLRSYNCVRDGGCRDRHRAIMKTEADADYWRVMVRLSFDGANDYCFSDSQREIVWVNKDLIEGVGAPS
jgi:hypothetical protein